MSTRANIIAKTTDGRWGRVYTHNDGYPDHHGPILLDHYTEQTKIDALIALGDLSSLAPDVGVKHPFDAPDGRMCRAYGRDRGETGVDPEFYDTFPEAYAGAEGCGAEFVYVWDGQCWGVGVPEDAVRVHPLREFMKGDLTLTQTVKAFGGDFVIATRTATAKEA